MRWLITGGCGFIGRSLVGSLLDEGGHTIRILDNLSVGKRKDLRSVCDFVELERGPPVTATLDSPTGVELVIGDILDEGIVNLAAQNIDVMVHLAANTGVGPSVEDPKADCRVNVFGTLNCLEAGRRSGIGRFVFASSGAPIGNCVPPIHEDLAPHPASPYGASKLAGEGYCSAYFQSFGLSTVALRFGNVYGPNSGHKDSVVAKFIRQAMAGEELEIFGDGSQTRDFIFIADLLSAIRKAAESEGVEGEVFQIATASETTVGELAEMLMERLEAAGIGPVKLTHGPRRIGDVQRNFSDTEKARRRLSWTPSVELEEGLSRTIAWFVNGTDYTVNARLHG